MTCYSYRSSSFKLLPRGFFLRNGGQYRLPLRHTCTSAHAYEINRDGTFVTKLCFWTLTLTKSTSTALVFKLAQVRLLQMNTINRLEFLGRCGDWGHENICVRKVSLFYFMQCWRIWVLVVGSPRLKSQASIFNVSQTKWSVFKQFLSAWSKDWVRPSLILGLLVFSSNTSPPAILWTVCDTSPAFKKLFAT